VNRLKKFIHGLKMVDDISRPLKLYYDSGHAVTYAHNNKTSDAAKHIDIKYYVVKDKVRDHYKSRVYKHSKDTCGSVNERLTTQRVQGTRSRHGAKG
jgi:hypothetical protein